MTNDSFSLSGDERVQLTKLFAALDGFNDIRDTMPLQYVRSFLLVCLNEGAGVGEIGKLANVPQSVASRHLLDLGNTDRHGRPGPNLLEQEVDPWERRKHKVKLTPAGVTLARRMVRVLNSSR